MKIAILGAGMVGRAIALDLARQYEVSAFDINSTNLEAIKNDNPNVNTVVTDLAKINAYSEWLAPFDIVVTAVPGFMGYKTLEAVIRAGKDVVDISFFPEDALLLSELAKERDVTAITDCGVAPGMSNFILGYYDGLMKISSFECYVGGLPKKRKPPFQYKAPFSPVDVIQEYIRPARLMENGIIVTRAALSEREILSFVEIGELEAFNTDGLRSLLHTMRHIPDMKEKTLRYPGHIDLIISLQQAGFFDQNTVQVNGISLSPLEFTSNLLINEWKLLPGEEEFTVMKIIIKGEEKEEKRKVEYDLLDWYDLTTQTSSMARTTGYTCTAAVNLITEKMFIQKGVFPPEIIGRNKDCFDFVITYLKQRGVNWRKEID